MLGAPAALAQQKQDDAPALRGSPAFDEYGASRAPSASADPRAYRSPAGSAIPAYGNASKPAGTEPLYDSSMLAPNYGKPRRPREKRLSYSGRRVPPAKALPPLGAYRTSANERAARMEALAAKPLAPGAEKLLAPPPATTVAAIAPPPPLRRTRIEEEPFAPIGLNLGGLRLSPYVDAQGGYDSNPHRTKNGGGSALLRADVGFVAQSDWSSHSLNAQGNASYFRFTSLPDASRPEANATATLKVDILRDTFSTFELRGSLATQRSGSPDVPGSTINQPIVGSVGVTSGLTQRLGRTEGSLSFLIDRRFYGDAETSTGVTRLSADNYNAYGARVRLAHELTPGVKPFLEAGADVRRRDEPIDAAGFARDSAGFLGRAGSTFELTRTLTGELSAGYGGRRYEDSRLPILAGPTIDARLVWAATALTNVTLRAVTEFNETTIANASGAVSRRLSAEVSHALLRNFTIGGAVTYSNNAYRGAPIIENTWAGALRADYAFNRFLVLRGSYAHERLLSSQPGASNGAHVFLLGLRLQP